MAPGKILDAHDRHLGDKNLSSTGETSAFENHRDGLPDRHDKTGHAGVGDGDRAPGHDLPGENRDYGPPGPKNIAKPDTRKDLISIVVDDIGRGNYALPHQLGRTHDIGGGLTALSELVKTTLETLLSMDAWTRFFTPLILV